jgi:hypothetical protein
VRALHEGGGSEGNKEKERKKRSERGEEVEGAYLKVQKPWRRIDRLGDTETDRDEETETKKKEEGLEDGVYWLV